MFKCDYFGSFLNDSVCCCWWWCREKNEYDEPDLNLVEKLINEYENDIMDQQWYFNNISRRNAEKILAMTSSNDRSFIIRKSNLINPFFVLSMKTKVENQIVIKHYKIQFEHLQFFITEREKFSSLSALVKAYFGEDQEGDSIYLKPTNFIFSHNPKLEISKSNENILEEGVVLEQNIFKDYESKIVNESWYYGVLSKKKIENGYLTKEIEDGMFMITKNVAEKYCFILSVKKWTNANTSHVKHYRIIFEPELSQFKICGSDVKGPSIAALVDFLTEKNIINKPCARNKLERQYDLSPKYYLDWEIPLEEFDIEKEILGKGNFGIIHKGIWQKKKLVAIKSILKAEHFDKDLFMKEIAIMKQVRHKYVICLYGMCTKKEPYLIIDEFASNGNLKNYITNRKGLSVTDYVTFACEISEGMDYLSNRNIVHRDLSCRNILLDEYLCAKISDFGLSRTLIDGQYISQSIGSIPYRWYPIESISENIFTNKSDVWSFGILMHEMFNNCKLPYEGIQVVDLLPYLLKGRRLSKPDNMPFNLYKICLLCWNAHEEKRPTFEKLKIFLTDYKLDGNIDDISILLNEQI